MSMFADSTEMSNVDLAWLRMERPTNPMMIVGVLTFATRLTLAAVRDNLAAHLMQFERLQQRPVDGVMGGRWERDAQFDLDAHVRALKLTNRAGQDDLEAAVSRLASKPLNPNRPMWQFHVVERYRKGSALIVRIHHCYADGMALVRLLLSLTDEQVAQQQPLPAAGNNSLVEVATAWLGNVLKPTMAMTGGVVQGALDLFASAVHTAAHPQQVTQLARQGMATGSEVARIALLSDDPPTPLKGQLSTHKHMAWGAPLPLTEIKTISRALDCTVNDALLATIAGALGSYLRSRGFNTDKVTLRAMVPVNLRPADSPVELGNYFGLVFVELPIGMRNPLARIYALHERMEALKQSPQAMVAYWMLSGMGVLPRMVEDYTLEVLTAKASAVISNVIGPQQPLYMAGARIEQMFFWVPQAGSIGVGISALTYNGYVHFGVMADRKLIAEPTLVVDKFNEEFEKLVLCTITGVTSGSA